MICGYYDTTSGWRIKNNGVLGIDYIGRDEEGRYIVELFAGRGLEENKGRWKIINNNNFDERFRKSFSASELNGFLDRFFEMNNMEAINEFSSSYDFHTEGDTLHMMEMYTLAYFNIMDYINQLSDGIIRNFYGSTFFEAGKYFPFQNIRIGGTPKHYFLEGTSSEESRPGYFFDETKASIDIDYAWPRNPQAHPVITDQQGETAQLLSIVKKAIADMPEICKRLRVGSYKKEDFVPTRDFLENKTALQQREDELSLLKAEAERIDREENLIEQNKGQDIGEE